MLNPDGIEVPHPSDALELKEHHELGHASLLCTVPILGGLIVSDGSYSELLTVSVM